MNRYLFVLLLIFSQIMKAQNDFQLSHFMYNEITFNPAATGNSDKLVTALVARQQWIGTDHAPSVQFFNAHTYVEPIKGGVGLIILNDRTGFENTLNIKLNYAYHQRISEAATLSGGFAVGFINNRLDGTKLIYQQLDDPNAIYTQRSVIVPDMGGGIEFNTSKITAGISSTHITQSQNNSTVYNSPRHYFLYAKYKINVNEKITVIPSFLVKGTAFIKQYELNSNVLYMEKYWIGVTYRFRESFVGMLGFVINEKFRVGYAFDFNAAPVNSFSHGSHEIMLQGTFKDFVKKKSDYKSPRFF